MNAEATLYQIVQNSSAAMKVLRQHRLDFCCQGKRSLASACEEAGLDPQAVLAELGEAEAEDEKPQSWETRPLLELVEHIIRRYHEPARELFPALVKQAAKLEAREAKHPHCPRGLSAELARMSEAMMAHLDREEEAFFPLLQGKDFENFPYDELFAEHEAHDRNLDRLRELTGNLTPPTDASAAWRRLYEDLDGMEADLMAHMYLENNILFDWFRQE